MSTIEQTWKDLQSGAVKAVENTFPIEGRHRRLQLNKIIVDEKGAKIGDIRGQENAKDRGRSWGASIHGDVSLIDKKTGKVIDRSKVKFMTLPKPTDRYSYIVNGNEYQVANLWKLKAGVYSMIKQNGDLETEFNLGGVKGEAAQFAKESIIRVPFSPKTQKFKFQWKDSNFGLYSVLKTLGVQDEDMKKAWGKEIYESNATGLDKIQKDISKLYKKISERGVTAKGEKYDDIASAVVTEFGKTKLDPNSAKQTLGIAATEVDGEALLQASRRILAVARGDELPDDRDSLAFKRLVGIDNFVREKISRPSARRNIHNKARNNIDRKNSVRDIITSDMFGKPVSDAFTGSLGRTEEQINPLEMISNFRSTTTLGGDVGGIKGEEKLTTQMKLINPSHMGFLDPIHTPESKRTGISLRLPLGVTKDGDVPKVLVYDLKEKKILSGKNGISPTEMQANNIILPDQVTWKGGELKPIGRRVKMKTPLGDIQLRSPKDARYAFVSPHQLFDEATNLIPFLQNNQGNRTMVASGQQSQAVGLVDREAPLVQVRAGKDSTWEKNIGIPFSHASPVTGEVVRIRTDQTDNKFPDSMVIKGDDGKRHEVQLYNHFPLNEAKSFMHSYPLVSKGDRVTAGQPLADTNFTKDGVLALGINLRVSYLPYKGYNFEDGIVISDSAAHKLTSDHVHRNRVEIDPSKDFLNKKKFQAFASVAAKGLSQEQLDKLDDDGVIQLGSRVEPGDMLIAALGKKENMGIVSKMSSSLSKGLFQYGDKSSRWDGAGPGEVVKVKKHPGGKWAEVHVRTAKPAEVGDKIVGRHGNKGIITKILPNREMPRIGDPDGEHIQVLLNPSGVPCYDEKTEFLTKRGWVFGVDLKSNDEIGTLNRKSMALEFQATEALHKIPYTGKMYRLENQQLDLLVTPNHRMYTARRGPKFLYGKIDTDHPELSSAFSMDEAKDIVGESRRYLKAGKWEGHDPWFFYIPEGTKGVTGKPAKGINISSWHWAQFMGWFVSEGSTYQTSDYRYVTEISQSDEANPENYQEIAELLSAMGFKFYSAPNGFQIFHKGLYEYLSPLGKCHEKYIPREVLDLPTKYLREFFRCYILGDGSERYNEATSHHGTISSSTVSKKLADDLQEVAIKIGKSVNIKEDKRKEKYTTGVCFLLYFSSRSAAPWVNWSSATKKNQIEEWVDYSGTVYCVTVPNGVVMVRRNGKHVFSGNSRINIGQMLETAASKIAKKTGQPYIVNNFPTAGTDYTSKVKKDLADNDLKDTEVLFDPKTKKRLGDVLTGDQYILKLKHQVEKKLTSRSYGPNYTLEGAPKGSGSQNPGQAIGQLEFYSLLAHGARANLRDMATYKADRQVDELHNPQAHTDFWERVKMGQPLPPPRPTFAYKKFEGYLKALGVDIRKDGSELQLIPLTDKGVLNLSNGEIKDPGLVLRGKDAKELQNGLFDPKVTGGLPDPNDVGKGLNWSHITLAEPMPNPVFVGTRQKPGPAVVLTGLKFNEFEDVVKGKKEVDGRTGGAAIQYMLDKVDIDKELVATEASLPGLRKDKLNKANRKAKYLRALQDLKKRGLVKSTSDAYVMNHVPVLPPVMRPIVPMPDGSLRFDDVNHLYQSLGIVNNKMKDKIKEIPELEQKLREELYDIMKATAGIGGVPKFESNRQLKGILDTIAGDSPKQGFFQRRLMKRRQELSMRSTIIPEPGMHLDNLGLPRAAAMEMYKPFVIRELTFAGFSPMDAHKAVKEGNTAAEKALEKAMEKRPVLLKRDPALHKFSFMAFKPKLVDGKAIRIHPLVTAGYNADFDGDAMAAFVPLSEEAADEAHKMFPSNNLFSSTTGDIMYSPAQESLLGLHLLSKWGKSTKKSFSNFAEAKQANNRGVIDTNDVITVGGKRTTFGRLTLVDNLPKDYSKNRDILHDPKFVLKSGSMKDMLADIARTDPRKFASTVDKLKDVGNKHAYESGFSISLNDLTVPKAARDQILSKADLKADMVNSMKIPQKDKDKRLIKIYESATSEMEKKLKPLFAASNNNLFTLVDSGARGKWSQFRQMNVAPMLMRDASGKTLVTPVRKSYSEGQDVGDYWTALHGARMGTLQRAEGTSIPGDIAKQLINTLIPELITSDDCGTSDGVAMNIADDDIHDRYLAKPVKAGSNRFSKGDLVTPHMTSALKRGGVNRIVVRSPLKCKHGSGICATCYGLNEDGKNHDLGTNIGVLAGHSMAEPSMQLAMDCNAAGNIVTVRISGDVHTLTFEQLWDRILSFVDIEGDVETKIPDSLDVWDHTRFVPVQVLQRHKPHSPMVLVRLESGHSFVCQSTHPNWARKDIATCPHCENQEPVSFSSHHDSGDKTSVRCPACRSTFSIARSLYEDQQERIVRSVDLDGSFLGFSSHQEDSVIGDMPLPPYLLGMYLAEGNVKRTKDVPSVEDGSKRRHQVSTGMTWKVLGVSITQNKGEIREQIIDELLRADIAFIEPSSKHIQLGDVRLARELWRVCGIHSHNKQLPPGWAAQDNKWKKEFLAGLLDGDGTEIEKHTAALDTASWSLVCQVQEIVRSLGGWSVTYATTVTNLTRHQGYRVTIDLPFRLLSVKDLPSVVCNALEGSYSRVAQVKEIEFYADWTYDLATETKGFSASGIRTHNSFHTGGVAASRGGGAANRLDRLLQILNPPEKLPGAATLSRTKGKIQKIERDKATKGWNIYVGGEKHFAPAQRTPFHRGKPLSIGKIIQRGDALTDGLINPRDLLPLTDVPTVQRYMVDELYNGIYKDERVRRRNIETVVRSLTNLAQVSDGGDSDRLPGDYVLRTIIEEENRKAAPGTRLIEATPILKGLAQGALDQQEDWMARLNFRRLKDTLMQGASKGWKTNIHGTNPIPAYAFGSQFGKGPTKATY